MHTRSKERRTDGLEWHVPARRSTYDERYVEIKRPTIVVGGELTMPMLDLKYNPIGKFYEAPLQMKANGGIFMIDDFGRQQVRPMDLLNRWIVPLEKRYDYLTTVTGTKIEVPFDQLLIFSTNLDPKQLADEAFLRRIKFKIEDPRPGRASVAADLAAGLQGPAGRVRRRGHRLPDREVVQADQPAVPHVPAARHPRPDDLDRQVQHGTGHVYAGPHRCRLHDLLRLDREARLRRESAIGLV